MLFLMCPIFLNSIKINFIKLKCVYPLVIVNQFQDILL
jgi:hypothetical protein